MVSRPRIILTIGFLLAAIAAMSLIYYVSNQPTKLTIAVGPADSFDSHLVDVIAQRLQNRREPVQLKIIRTDGSVSSAEALDSGKVDLAVIRGDLPKQPSAGVVVTLHKDPVIFLAAPDAGIRAIADLKGKRIGVIRARASDSDAFSVNTELLRIILNYYSLGDGSVTLVPVTIDQVLKAAEEKRIDAVFSVGPVNDPRVLQVVEGMASGSRFGPAFIPISEPDALILKNPLLLKDEIVRGAFGGQPPTPALAIPTIAVTHSIAASNNLSDGLVADLARTIIKLRPALAREIKLASGIEVPSSDKNAAMPLHPGAAAYIDNEEQTFFDKYGDIVYIAAMLFGLLGSGAAALFSRWSSNARSAAIEHIEDSVDLVSDARAAKTIADIDAIEIRADRLFENVMRNAVQSHLNQTDIASFNLSINQVRQVLKDRREEFLTEPHLSATQLPSASQMSNDATIVAIGKRAEI